MSEREFCTNCGTERRPGAKFCAKCGTRFEDPAPAEPEQPPPQPLVAPSTPQDPVASAAAPAAAPFGTILAEPSYTSTVAGRPPFTTTVPPEESRYLLTGTHGAVAGILIGGAYWWIAARIGPLPGLSFLFRTGPTTYLVLAAIITGVLAGLATVIFAGRRTLPLQLMAAGAAILGLVLGRMLFAVGNGVTLGPALFRRVGLVLPLFMEFISCAAAAALAASPLFPYSRRSRNAQTPSSTVSSFLGAAQATEAREATGQEHYVLRCRSCDFEHHIPSDTQDAAMRFSVAPTEVKMTCVYGGAFTVSLQVREFFTIEPTPASGRVLHASIGDNVKAVHGHLLSHWDPLFLQIDQTANSTHHTYLRQQPAAMAFVKFSSTGGIDIVGNIDVAKAEIPGVSWQDRQPT